MVEAKEKGQSPCLLLAIKSAYDLSSVGMGVQAHAVRLLQTTSAPEALPAWAEDAVVDYSSNYLCQPYVFGFLNPESRDARLFPCHPSPSVPQHTELLRRTNDEYEALLWQVTRAALAGDQDIPVDDPSKPIFRPEDLRPYVKSAERRGLISRRKPERLFKERGGFNNFLLFASNAGVVLENKFFDLHQETLFSPQFRPKLIQASTHKLACMLAVTEQILYDASFSGQPIPASYKPEDQTHQTNWKEMFSEEMPEIGDLYQQALGVLKSVADPNDPLINYLLTLDVSQYLAG